MPILQLAHLEGSPQVLKGSGWFKYYYRQLYDIPTHRKPAYFFFLTQFGSLCHDLIHSKSKGFGTWSQQDGSISS
jgi:hypothetical protein